MIGTLPGTLVIGVHEQRHEQAVGAVLCQLIAKGIVILFAVWLDKRGRA